MKYTQAVPADPRMAQVLTWEYFKPRHTHAWNMLALAWRQLPTPLTDTDHGFETEYRWENFILRLWLYRAAAKTLTRIEVVKDDALTAIRSFDNTFTRNGESHLKALRDMIEHFDDYAAGDGHGPGVRERDLDPWRPVDSDRYDRGIFSLEREASFTAANDLRLEIYRIGNNFIEWVHAAPVPIADNGLPVPDQ